VLGHRPVRDDDYVIISKFPQDKRELFYMFPKGTFPLSANQLKDVAQARTNPTVITKNEEVVGYCNLYDVSSHDCWLGNVIIKPQHRGNGIGKYLVETMIEYAKAELEINYFRLVCHNVNTRALLFYSALGFKPFDSKVLLDPDGNQIVGIKMEIKI